MPTQDIAVRPIELRDIGSFAECVGSVIAERDYLAWQAPFPIESTAQFVASNIRLRNPQFVADDGGVVVGWCDIARSTVPIHLHSGVLGMGMLPAYRGKGLGLRLMLATLAAARDAGIERVDLAVFARNTRAVALYRTAGFREVGRRVRGKKLAGEYDDEILMEMPLDP